MGSKGADHKGRITLNVGGSDSLSSAAPAGGAGLLVHGPKTFGAPVVMMGEKLGFRFGSEDWRFTGVGAFIVGVEGHSCLVSWPMTRIADAGVNDERKFLEGASAADARKYMSRLASWTSLGPGDVFWLPYCHHVFTLAETHGACFVVLPCFDPALIARAPPKQWNVVAAGLRRDITDGQAREPVKNFGAQLLAFLNGVSLAAASSAGA